MAHPISQRKQCVQNLPCYCEGTGGRKQVCHVLSSQGEGHVVPQPQVLRCTPKVCRAEPDLSGSVHRSSPGIFLADTTGHGGNSCEHSSRWGGKTEGDTREKQVRKFSTNCCWSRDFP